MSVKYDAYQKRLAELQQQGKTSEDILQDYVDRNPDKYNKIQKLIKGGTNVDELAKAVVYKESKPSLLKEATSSFMESGSETMKLLDTLLGRVTGSDYYNQRAQEWAQQAEEYSNPDAKNIFESKNLSEGAHSASRMAGGLLEFMLEAALGGAEGKLASGAIKALTKKGIDKAVLEGIGKEATKTDLIKEAIKKNVTPEALGTYTQITLPEIERQYEAGGEQHPLQATAGGALTGLLYTASPLRAIKALRPEEEAITKEMVDLNRPAAEQIPKGSNKAIEALKEGLVQSATLGTAAATSEFGSNQQFNPTEIGQQALLGGMFGGLTGLLHKSPDRAEQEKIVQSYIDELKSKKAKEETVKKQKEFEENIKSQKNFTVDTNKFMSDWTSNIEKQYGKQTGLIPVSETITKSEPTYRFEALHKHFGFKGLEEPVTKNEQARSIYVREAFDKGWFVNRLNLKFDKYYKVLKSVGISDKEILDKHYKDIQPKDYTKEMAEAAIYQNPKNAEIKVTIDNIDNVFNRALEIKDKLGKSKNKNVDSVIIDLKNKTNNLIDKYKETYLEKFKLYKNKKDVEEFVNDQIKTIAKNKKPKDFYSSLIKTKALIDTLPKIVEDKVKVQVLKDLITGEYLNKMKSISSHTGIKGGNNLPIKRKTTDLVKVLEPKNDFTDEILKQKRAGILKEVNNQNKTTNNIEGRTAKLKAEIEAIKSKQLKNYINNKTNEQGSLFKNIETKSKEEKLLDVLKKNNANKKFKNLKDLQDLKKSKKEISNIYPEHNLDKKLINLKKELNKVKSSNQDKKIIDLKKKFESIDNLKTSSGKLKRLKKIKEELNKINHKDKQELLDRVDKKEFELKPKKEKITTIDEKSIDTKKLERELLLHKSNVVNSAIENEYDVMNANIYSSVLKKDLEIQKTLKDKERQAQKKNTKKVSKTNNTKVDNVKSATKKKQITKKQNITKEEKIDFDKYIKLRKKGEPLSIYEEDGYGLAVEHNIFGSELFTPYIKNKGKARIDIENFTSNEIPKDIREKLIKVKKQYLEREKELEKKSKLFTKSNIEKTKSVPESYSNLINELTKGLDLNTKIFIAYRKDLEDINAKEKYGLHGKYSTILSYYTESEPHKREAEGYYYIILNDIKDNPAHIEILGHEFGHILEPELFNRASKETKEAIVKSYNEWLKNTKGITKAEDLIAKSRPYYVAQESIEQNKGFIIKETTNTYGFTSFNEWFADNVSKWITTTEKPRTLVEKFFKTAAEAFRKLFQIILKTDDRYKVDKAVKDFLDKQFEKGFEQREKSIEQVLTEAKDNILNLGYSIEGDDYKLDEIFSGIKKEEKTLKAKLKDRNVEYYITPPPELKPENLKDFDTYLKYLGLDKVKDKDFISIERGELKKLYKIRKEQIEKGITKENLEAVAQVVSYLQIPFSHRRFSEKRLFYRTKELYKEYTTAHKTIVDEIDKSFNINARKTIENIFGKELANKIKVKSISHITLEDLGGRENVINIFKKDYNIDYSNLSDKELLDKLKSVEGSMITNPKDGSILIMLAHHTNDNIGFVLHHELFHIVETHGLLSDKELDSIKKELDKRYPNDDREWYEKAADDFALYSVNKKLIPVKVRLIFAKIKQFLNKLGMKFKQNPEDIYAKILAGKAKPDADMVAYLHYRLDTLQPRLKANPRDEFDVKLIQNSGRDLRSFKEKAIEESKSFISKFIEFFAHFGKGLAPEAYTEGFHLHVDAIRHLAAIKEIAHHRTQKDLNYILQGLNDKDKLLLERVLILRDIKYNLDTKTQTFYAVNKQWGEIFKDEADINNKLSLVEKELQNNSKVQNAIKRRVEVHNEVIDYLRKAGYIDYLDDLDPERYFHRITTAYFNQKLKLKMPYAMEIPKIDVLRERKNSTEPYITDYIYSDYEALAQLHLLKRYDEIQDKLKEASKSTLNEMLKDYAKLTGKDLETIKEDFNTNTLKLAKVLDTLRQTEYSKKYEQYTVKKVMEMPHFYTVWTLPTDLTTKILNQTLTEKEMADFLSDPVMNKKVAIRKYTEELLIPKSALKSIRNLTEFHSPSPVLKLLQFNIGLFKKFTLFSPFRFAKYTWNNFTSDLDILFATSPSVVKRYGVKSFSDLKDYFYNKGRNLDEETRAEIEEAVENLVLGTNITSEEVVSINGLEGFKDLFGTKPNLYNKWWEFSAKFNNFRESILRLAVYRWYKEELAAGRLEELPSVVDYKVAKQFLKEGKEKELAAKLARELVGDYGNISPSGQWLRKNLIPFWSWTEVNIPRYAKLLKNSFKLKSRYGKLYPAVFALKASILYSAITMWNMTMFPQVSDTINDANNGQLHLILGRKPNGEYLTMRFQGSLNDLLDWGGLGNLSAISKEIKNGELDWFDVLKNVPKSAVNKLINMSAPIQKTVLEDISGLNFYPDVFHPSVIRDKTKHALALYGLGLPYKLIFSPEPTPKDDKGLLNILYKTAESSLLYSTDINSANYHIVRELVTNYLQKNNLYRYSIIQQDKSNYAFYYKKAIQYGDKDKAIHFLAMYYYYGGTLKSMEKSIKMMSPLNMIPKIKRADFYNTISPEDRGRLQMYLNWYNDVFIRKSKFNNKDLLEIYRNAYKLSLELKNKKKK